MQLTRIKLCVPMLVSIVYDTIAYVSNSLFGNGVQSPNCLSRLTTVGLVQELERAILWPVTTLGMNITYGMMNQW